MSSFTSNFNLVFRIGKFYAILHNKINLFLNNHNQTIWRSFAHHSSDFEHDFEKRNDIFKKPNSSPVLSKFDFAWIIFFRKFCTTYFTKHFNKRNQTFPRFPRFPLKFPLLITSYSEYFVQFPISFLTFCAQEFSIFNNGIW